MPSAQVYFNNETYSAWLNLDSGTRSQIVQNAIKEHSQTTDSLDKVNIKLDLAKQELSRLEGEISYLEKRQKELQEIENTKQETLKNKKQERYNLFLEITLKHYEISEQMAKEWAEEWSNQPENVLFSKFQQQKVDTYGIKFKPRELNKKTGGKNG